MSETVEQLITNLIAAWNAHDVEGVTALYAPDYEEVDVGQTGPQRGPECIRRLMLYYLRAFPDLKLVLDDLITDGDRAALAWTLHGTQRGTIMNIPPTGRAVAVRGTSLLTVQDGKIRRGLRLWDVAGLLRALGLLPEL
jgi:steroid delta-isomerase-like uncharacterized protein